MDKLTMALGVVNHASPFIPIVGQYLKEGIDLLIKIGETVEKTKDNEKTLESLVNRTIALSLAIVDRCNGVPEAQYQKLLGVNLKSLLGSFEATQLYYYEKQAKNSQKKSKFRNGLRYIKLLSNATKDEGTLKSLSDDLDRAIRDCQLLSDIDQILKLDGLNDHVLRVLARIDRLSTGLDDDRLRNRLKPVTQALFSATATPAKSSDGTSVPLPTSTMCHDGTFEGLLDELVDWATSSAAQSVYWLSGQAGTGKSTVARTLCYRLATRAVAKPRIITSFFISRLADADRRDPRRIIHTLSYVLARHLPKFRTELLRVLDSDVGVTDCGVAELIRELIARPLERCVGQTPAVVIVLDAVDECDVGNDRLGREGGDLLPLLLSTVKSTKLRVRLLITSRSTPSITRMFHDYRLQAVSQSRTADCVPFLYQRSIEVSLLRPDIRRYFDKEFRIIAEHYNLSDWPAPAAIDSLVEQADGLFIYADTVVRFVLGGFDPEKNLQVFVDTSTATSSSIEYATLDNTYTRVLETAAASIAGPRASRTNAALIRRVLGTLAVVRKPCDATGLARLIGEVEVDSVLSRLTSVLTRTEAGKISFYHASFPDYLLDETRCSDERFRGSRTNAHRALVIRCFEIMNQSLRRDMAELGDEATDDLPYHDLSARISETFSSELIYATTYWHHHFQEITHGGSFPDCSDQLKTFCEDHLLHWVEACSLLRISDDPEDILLSCCQATFEDGPVTGDILRDAARFLRHFRKHVWLRPQMLYPCAALFLPDCDLRRAALRSLGETSLPVQIVGRAASWDDLPVDIYRPYHAGEGRPYYTRAPSDVRSLICSPDGSRLLLVFRQLRQTLLSLHDTFSGAPLQTQMISGDPPRAVAWPPPGDCIALVTQPYTQPYEDSYEICIWNLASRTCASCRYVFPPGYDHVLAMAFQPGDHSVSVVLSNRSDCLVVTFAVDYHGNEIRFGETTLHPLVFPSGDTRGVLLHVPSGSYSVTGEYCAIASTLIVNVYQGLSYIATLEMPPSAVSVLQFSSPLPREGPNLAAGGADGSVVVWSVMTKAIIHTFAGLSDGVKSLAFSTTTLAAATDRAVVVWSLDDFRCIWKAQMHTDGIVLPPPTPLRNARLFVATRAGDGDLFVRGLNLAAALTPPIDKSVECMGFSPTSSLLYSISPSAASIWDVQTGRYLQSFPYDTSRDEEEYYDIWSEIRRQASWETCSRHGLLLCMFPSQTPSWARDSTGQWVPHESQSDCTTTTPKFSTGILHSGPSHVDGALYRLVYDELGDIVWLCHWPRHSSTPGHPPCAPRLLFLVPVSKRIAPDPTSGDMPHAAPRLVWSENGQYLAIGHAAGDVTIFKLSAEIAHLLTLRDVTSA